MTPRQDRIKILQNRAGNLSFEEQIELISCKYYEKQFITYEEFVLLALFDEVEFAYKDKLYQIDYGLCGVVSIFVIQERDNKSIKNQSFNYISIFELLNEFKIDGKKIREIWDYAII